MDAPRTARRRARAPPAPLGLRAAGWPGAEPPGWQAQRRAASERQAGAAVPETAGRSPGARRGAPARRAAARRGPAARQVTRGAPAGLARLEPRAQARLARAPQERAPPAAGARPEARARPGPRARPGA